MLEVRGKKREPATTHVLGRGTRLRVPYYKIDFRLKVVMVKAALRLT